MIDRLITTLQALAAPPAVQCAQYPDLVTRRDGVALDFADALRLVLDCPQLELTAEQIAALEAVDAYLEQRSGARGSDFWSENALRTSAAWQAVRGLAARALAQLGAPSPTRGAPMG